MPVPAPGTTRNPLRSTRAPSSSRFASRPNSSSPMQPTKRTSAPSRAAARAWFAPLPPGTREQRCVRERLPRPRQSLDRGNEVEVDRPDDGDRRPAARHLRGQRPQVVDGAAVQVLAKIEEAGPERAPVGHRPQASRGGETFERAHEHRQLEVGLGHAIRRCGHARAAERLVPVQHLPCARLAVPRAALRPRQARARGGSGQAVARGPQGLSRHAPLPGEAPPRGAARSTARAHRAPSGRAGGRTRARRPRWPRATARGEPSSPPRRRRSRRGPPSRCCCRSHACSSV